jgi:hypothetical protein
MSIYGIVAELPLSDPHASQEQTDALRRKVTRRTIGVISMFAVAGICGILVAAGTTAAPAARHGAHGTGAAMIGLDGTGAATVVSSSALPMESSYGVAAAAAAKPTSKGQTFPEKTTDSGMESLPLTQRSAGTYWKGYYTISGGKNVDLRGRYNKMGPEYSCNGKPVYKLDGGWFGTDYYLFQHVEADECVGLLGCANTNYQRWSDSWIVAEEYFMQTCAAHWSNPRVGLGFTPPAGVIISQGDCAGDPSGSGCAGKWMAASGTDAGEWFSLMDNIHQRSIHINECDGFWCTEASLTVV